jgi:hypothetical protein
VVLDVLLAPADGSDRSCNPQTDPVVAIACHVTHTGSSSSSSGGGSGGSSGSNGGSRQRVGRQQGAGAREDLAPAGDDSTAPAAAAGSSGSNGGSNGSSGSSKVVFLLSSPAAGAVLPPELCAEGVCIRLCPSERDLLLSWKEWLLLQDPDGLVVFQVSGGLV